MQCDCQYKPKTGRKVMAAYYNENDPQAAEWLRELIKANAIAPGDVEAYREKVLQAHAVTNRVAMLRGYGNAIVPQVAQVFIEAALEWNR